MEKAWESTGRGAPEELIINPAGVTSAYNEDNSVSLVTPTTSPTPDEGSLSYEPPFISLSTSLVYASGGFGSGIFLSFNSFMQSFFLIALGAPPILFALLGSQQSFEGAIIQPLVGAWSDRTWTRWGRRRIFILRFVPPCVVLTAATPFLPQVARLVAPAGVDPKLMGLIFVSAAIFLFSLAFNMSQDPYLALLADITPQRQRGVVNGILQSIASMGWIAILLVGAIFGAPYTVLYLLVGVSLLVFFVPTLLGIREPRVLPGANAHKRYTLRDYARALGADRELQLYYAVQFFTGLGATAVTVFITPYAVNVVGFSERQAFVVPIILLVAVAVGAWSLGWLSNRLSLKGVYFLGVLLSAVGVIILGLLHTPLSLYAAMFLVGVGTAAALATSYPLLSRLVFPDQMGLYTGLRTTVSSVAAPLSSAIGGVLVSGLGYGALFMFVGAWLLVALIPLAFLRIERSVVARARAAAGVST
jgi:maltose/moltooligosaccharide transporter